MDYVAYVQTLWAYLPYIVYTFVFVTFVPKTLRKIKDFAAADYAANRSKYHRCYAPDICCHELDPDLLPKQKARKAVTRVYPKRQAASATSQSNVSPSPAQPSAAEPHNIYKRQVHTHTHVTQIAKMFESGGAQRKINRVTPTILPFENHLLPSTHRAEEEECAAKKSSQRPAPREQENDENSSSVLNAVKGEVNGTSWRSEPITIQRRKRAVPSSLLFVGGTSATPSTASPAASSPLSSPQSSGSPVSSSPALRLTPALSMKSSVEDIFAAIALSAEKSEEVVTSNGTLAPVTSIDDILSERRLSRPLSAYSISDLLNDDNSADLDGSSVESFLRTLNKT